MILLDLSLKNNLYIVDIFDAALQELEILFDTNNCELLGDSSFGTNFDQYLWSMTPTTTDLKDYISVVYKESKNDWKKAEVVITTIQKMKLLMKQYILLKLLYIMTMDMLKKK